MRLNTYLAYKDGRCEEAMTFYKDIFNGEFTTFMRFGEAPPTAFKVAEKDKDLVMHCTLEFNNCLLMASDTILPDKVNPGNNFSLSINVANENEAASYFNALMEGGTEIMPFEDAFWGGKFGMLLDKFGVQWMFTSAHKTE